MGIHYYLSGALVLLLALGFSIINGDAQSSTTLVPAIITFGDSTVNIGNNDYIPTIFKANYPPYGRDFINCKPTGRFCNGKLATDITADTLGFTTYPPAYLSPQASGKNLLIGANFASAASGYDDKTAILSGEMNLEGHQILSLFIKVMKKFYKHLHDIAAKEIDSTLPRRREIVLKPHAVSVDEDLNEAAGKVKITVNGSSRSMVTRACRVL